ncbi:Hypothetical predicted protein [Lecanosticta acicola]|uniref:Uncharacterized protein n=1 Tax=Lecanosticta acicola TaxID=111012 RepID=A0AAI8Z8B7_9PEZI|nr:Hypothetical predicted protein [Lecanosticta acicola]
MPGMADAGGNRVLNRFDSAKEFRDFLIQQNRLKQMDTEAPEFEAAEKRAANTQLEDVSLESDMEDDFELITVEQATEEPVLISHEEIEEDFEHILPLFEFSSKPVGAANQTKRGTDGFRSGRTSFRKSEVAKHKINETAKRSEAAARSKGSKGEKTKHVLDQATERLRAQVPLPAEQIQRRAKRSAPALKNSSTSTSQEQSTTAGSGMKPLYGNLPKTLGLQNTSAIFHPFVVKHNRPAMFEALRSQTSMGARSYPEAPLRKDDHVALFLKQRFATFQEDRSRADITYQRCVDEDGRGVTFWHPGVPGRICDDCLETLRKLGLKLR